MTIHSVSQAKHAPTIAPKGAGYVKAAKAAKFSEVVHTAKHAKKVWLGSYGSGCRVWVLEAGVSSWG